MLITLLSLSLVVTTQAFHAASPTSRGRSQSLTKTTTSLSFANLFRQKLASEYSQSIELAEEAPTPALYSVQEPVETEAPNILFLPSKIGRLKGIWTKTRPKATRLVKKVSSVVSAVKAKVTKNRVDVAEREQRDLLAARLQMNTKPAAPKQPEAVEMAVASAKAEVPKRRVVSQPLSRRKEERLAQKYASIDSLEERAYTILKDLGMVDPSLDFSI